METILELRGITKKFASSGSEALRDIDLDVYSGEMLGLIGESGSGKTTLLRLIAGLESPTKGVIKLKDRIIVGDNTFVPPEKREIGMVFQEYALFPHMTVEQNVSYGLHKMDKISARKRMFEVLEWVSMADLSSRYAHELSGGQQQRAALARALAPSPSIILLDEPFSNLDGLLKDQMREELQTILKASGTTAIFVTHDTLDALSVADRLALLKDGQLQQIGNPKELYEKPGNLYTATFLGKINQIKGRCTHSGIVSDFGTFPVCRGLKEGKEVLIAIRPENISLQSRICTDLKGEVIHTSFLGDHLLVHLKPLVGDHQHRLIFKMPSAYRIKLGEVVGFKIETENLIIFDSEY